MFKKILVCLLPLVTLVGCNNGGGPNPPEPTVDAPLYIANLGSDVTVRYRFYAGDEQYTPNLQYSFDQKEWKTLEIVHGTDTDICTLPKNQTIYFRGNNPNSFCRYSNTIKHEEIAYFRFKLSNPSGGTKLKIGGNIMSLLSIDNYTNKKDIPCDGCFSNLFNDFKSENENYTQGVETSDIDASELLLPATELKPYAYFNMFSGSSISKAPLNLPATNPAQGMYECMFENCENLVTAPIINLNNLLESSCSQMFNWCSNLDITKDTGKTKIFTCPEGINATNCVYHMFYETKQIIEADPQPNEVFYYN